jgi:hypothetical protein
MKEWTNFWWQHEEIQGVYIWLSHFDYHINSELQIAGELPFSNPNQESLTDIGPARNLLVALTEN